MKTFLTNKNKIKMKTTIVALLIYGFMIGSYIVNIVKLVNCNFEAPWKNEVIHAIGLIPGCSIVTAWF
jgi:hypothetical protein